eukprot:GHVP01007319.1.p1 GENE.GHVP01007319.1~~GHVP01007319.1.p1  ORF type:complete len:652 (+),score=173.97 GHVP01007319.1:27-1958(+)
MNGKTPRVKRSRWSSAKNEEETQEPKGGFSSTPGVQEAPVPFDVAVAAAKAREALEKAKKAAMLRKEFQKKTAISEAGSKISSVAQLQAFAGVHAAAVLYQAPKPRPLRLDRFGRELDEEGKVVPLKPLVIPTLKVNINREKEDRIRQMTNLIKRNAALAVSGPKSTSKKEEESSFFDPNIVVRKPKKGLRFVEHGFFILKEQQLNNRSDAKNLGIDLNLLKQQKAQEAPVGNFSRDPNLIPLGKRIVTSVIDEDQMTDDVSLPQDEKAENNVCPILGRFRPAKTTKDAIPDIESWDIPLLIAVTEGEETEGEFLGPNLPFILNISKITNLVEHPVPFSGSTSITNLTTSIPVYLTKEERKKLRRRKRQEKEKDKQDKIRMGLLPPPPPKIKLSNLARSLATQTMSDGITRAEKIAREQMKQRLKDHEDRNQARKLTADERAKKKQQKWQPSSGKVYVLVVWIKDLTDRRALFKIDRNAQQLHLSGACVLFPPDSHGLVVEGSIRAIKKFRALLTRRMQWHTYSTIDGPPALKDPEEIDVEAETKSWCKILWEGVTRDREFKNWRVCAARTTGEARKAVSTKHSDYYWSLISGCKVGEIDSAVSKLLEATEEAEEDQDFEKDDEKESEKSESESEEEDENMEN